MATNKHATIRYHALDTCFSNTGRRYFIEDLIKGCNEALYEFTGLLDGVKRRQIFDDIKFMESEQGWSIPLDRLKEGKRTYYQYSDRDYSIKKQAINQSEAEQLRETLSILTRFKGIPQFEWIEELLVRVEDTFQLKGENQVIVGFEQNPFLKGLEYFTGVFNAIQNHKALEVEYKGFRQQEPTTIVIHPWYLKEYNNRWFLFGFNESVQQLSNLALDRVLSINESHTAYRKNVDIDFEEFFEDVVGVSVKPDKEPEKVLVHISMGLWPYIESKPIHGSQKIKSISTEGTLMELNVQINHELIALLFSFMDGVEVVEPIGLRNLFKEKAKAIQNKYS